MWIIFKPIKIMYHQRQQKVWSSLHTNWSAAMNISKSVRQLAFAQDHQSLKRFCKEFPTIGGIEQRPWDNLLTCVLENLINWNWQEQQIHFSWNQSWIRVQNSDQISLWRRGFSEFFWLFMLKICWKISLLQRVIISNWRFILRNIQTWCGLNNSLTLATWFPGLLSVFL